MFQRRDIRNELIPGTGKTLGQLSDGTTQQLKFNIFELKDQGLYEKTPVDHIAGSPRGPFTADLFSETFELVELAPGSAGKFDGMEVSQSFWGGPREPALEVAERKGSGRKNRSSQKTAKRKKRRGKKVGDTASITLNKPIKNVVARKKPLTPRIQQTESGYLGYAR